MASFNRLQKLGEYLRPYVKTTLLGVLALLIVNILGAYIPWLIKDGIDDLTKSITYDKINQYVLVIIILACIMWLIRVISRVVIFGIGRQVEFDLKQKIFEHLLGLDPGYFHKNPAGDLISRATSDLENVRRLLGFAVLSIVNIIFAYGFTLPIILSIHARLSLIALIPYPVILMAVQLFSDKLRKEQLVVQERLSDLSGMIEQDISGIGLIKIYGQEEAEINAFKGINQRLLQANIDLAKTRTNLFPIIEGLAYVSTLLLLAFGSFELANGSITVGDLVSLLIYIERLIFPTALLGFTITAYQRGEVSVDRIEAILSAKSEIVDYVVGGATISVRGGIRAKNLSYRYLSQKSWALNDVCFEIKPKEKVAIVGKIGSGKSTLANALPRLLNVDGDQLFIDDYDVTKISLKDLRGFISYVPQDSFLFSMSVRDNIAYGNPGLRDSDEVEEVAILAQIHEEILNFPQGYETMVGERGITLSGGQRQRVALARALLMAAPILILDDALSSVDNQTATNILSNLGAQSRTVIFISHQLSAAASCDRILVMDSGAIIQSGSHQDLIKEVGLYQSLWLQQEQEQYN